MAQQQRPREAQKMRNSVRPSVSLFSKVGISKTPKKSAQQVCVFCPCLTPPPNALRQYMHSILHSSVIVFSHCFHVTRHLVAFPNAAKPTGLDETMLVTRSALRYDTGGHSWPGLHCRWNHCSSSPRRRTPSQPTILLSVQLCNRRLIHAPAAEGALGPIGSETSSAAGFNSPHQTLPSSMAP